MRCPHCRIDFHDHAKFTYLGSDADGQWAVKSVTCSSCNRFVVFLENGNGLGRDIRGNLIALTGITTSVQVRPKGSSRPSVPSEVPSAIAKDYEEAALTLNDSPKASAALSRRCLQHVLREAAKVTPADLANEIQQVLDSGKLPTHLAESIDAVRNIGNFSAHPVKAKGSGEILPVEPHEAEWNLDVLESVFDFYYVQPSVLIRKRAALDAKLATAGKSGLKG